MTVTDGVAGQVKSRRLLIRCMLMAVGLIAWGAAILAALSLAGIRCRWDGLLCGPWGCAAPLMAIVACHAAWTVVLTPLAVLAWINVPAHDLRRISRCLLFGATCALVTIVICESFRWIRVRRGAIEHLLPFVGVEIVNDVELPLVEVFTLAGMLAATSSIAAHRSRRDFPQVSRGPGATKDHAAASQLDLQ